MQPYHVNQLRKVQIRRAATLKAAVELRGGEGLGSRKAFRQLAEAERAALIAFLKTL